MSGNDMPGAPPATPPTGVCSYCGRTAHVTTFAGVILCLDSVACHEANDRRLAAPRAAPPTTDPARGITVVPCDGTMTWTRAEHGDFDGVCGTCGTRWARFTAPPPTCPGRIVPAAAVHLAMAESFDKRAAFLRASVAAPAAPAEGAPPHAKLEKCACDWADTCPIHGPRNSAPTSAGGRGEGPPRPFLAGEVERPIPGAGASAPAADPDPDFAARLREYDEARREVENSGYLPAKARAATRDALDAARSALVSAWEARGARLAKAEEVIAGTAYPSDATLTREQAFHGWEVANRQRDGYAAQVEALRAERDRIKKRLDEWAARVNAAEHDGGAECSYCHGVGACPRCWGRAGIERAEARAEAAERRIADVCRERDDWMRLEGEAQSALARERAAREEQIARVTAALTKEREIRDAAFDAARSEAASLRAELDRLKGGAR